LGGSVEVRERGTTLDGDAARAGVDRRPALIVRCATVSDVVRSVKFARDISPPKLYFGSSIFVAGKFVMVFSPS